MYLTPSPEKCTSTATAVLTSLVRYCIIIYKKNTQLYQKCTVIKLLFLQKGVVFSSATVSIFLYKVELLNHNQNSSSNCSITVRNNS